jgi:hypothetical protein
MVLQTAFIPTDLDPARKVEANIVDYGYVSSYRVFEFQIDCKVEGQDAARSFVVRVPVSGPDDTKQLAWVRRFHVILDEARQEPAYLLLDDTHMVACTEARERAHSGQAAAPAS